MNGYNNRFSIMDEKVQKYVNLNIAKSGRTALEYDFSTSTGYTEAYRCGLHKCDRPYWFTASRTTYRNGVADALVGGGYTAKHDETIYWVNYCDGTKFTSASIFVEGHYTGRIYKYMFNKQ